MIFYDCSTAPSPRRARMFLAEKGIEVDLREVSILEGEQLKPEFLSVNPDATVPVLVTDDGEILTENLGIAAYLEALKPEPALIGTTPIESGEIMSWNAKAEQQCGMAMAEALRNGNPFMKNRAIPGPNNFDQIPELAERGLRRLGLFFDKLDKHLEGRDFVATNQFTMADITCFVFVDCCRVVKVRVTDGHPNLKRWYNSIGARDSAKA
ncbi:glutathione S-transferase family protein [Shimia sediminis]|uniref:glutathione S-transferase family protein n=1 Tax=Shimia sediminis TaxID=2497945 RepID=UPI000F8F30F3|nr:glutathione S-transferase family protein [Shimia sediminis]